MKRGTRKVSWLLPERILSDKQRKQTHKFSVISRYISTAKGRATLASAMVSPIRTSLDYSGIGRRAMMIQQMPEPKGIIFRYKETDLEEEDKEDE